MKAVAIISGGIDSTCYAAQWKAKGYEVHPLIFDYGQKGRKEIEVAIRLSEKLGFQAPKVLDISFMRGLWRGTQLTDEAVRVESAYTPSVVVPIRNAVFLTIATAYAYTIGADKVIYGSHAGDVKPRPDTGEPLYPDCAPPFISALQDALNLGHFPVHEKKVEIWCPAKEGLSKAENLRRGYELMGDLIFKTWSCYLSGDKQCGKCESCLNRGSAFREAGVADLTEYGA